MSTLVQTLPGYHQVTKLILAGTARQLLRPQCPHPKHAAEAMYAYITGIQTEPPPMVIIQITHAVSRPQT